MVPLRFGLEVVQDLIDRHRVGRGVGKRELVDGATVESHPVRVPGRRQLGPSALEHRGVQVDRLDTLHVRHERLGVAPRAAACVDETHAAVSG